MSFLEFVDKHIVFTGLMAFLLMLATSDVFGSWAKAFASRRRREKD